MTRLDALARRFTEDEINHFQGRGGQTLSYVEDETVMDRLDEAFGVGHWSVLVEPIPVYEGVVKVRMGAQFGDAWVWHEDFGYPNNGTGGEALKEAVSDGIRRCGRYYGIARDLYRRPANGPARQERPTAAAPVQQRPRPHVVDTDLLEPDDEEPFDEATAPMRRPQPLVCPHHPNREPRQNSRGYFCSGKDCPCANEKGYCTWTAA